MTTFVMDQGATFPPTGLEMSAWTPKSNKSFNARLFQERFELIKKWFDAWSKNQKWQLIEYVLLSLSDDDIAYLHSLIDPLFPPPPPPPPPLPKEVREDFTRILPRFLSLKIFSYLDPRSLCRASQVSWHWHDLTQQNVLWRPKCLKYSWFLPNQYQQQLLSLANPNTLWKRHYINCVLNMFWKPSDDKSLSLPQTPPTSSNHQSATPSTSTSVTPTQSPTIDIPTQPVLESLIIKEPQSNITGSLVAHERPPWIHSSKFPQDLIKTSLSRENREYGSYSLPGKRLQMKSFKREPMPAPSVHANTISGSSPVHHYQKSSDTDRPLQSPVAEDHPLLPTHTDSPMEDPYYDDGGSPAHCVSQPILDPALMERMRVHVPCSDQSITLSTINGDTERANHSLKESIKHIQQASPFPQLKPYYVEGDYVRGHNRGITEDQKNYPVTGSDSSNVDSSTSEHSMIQGNDNNTNSVDIHDSKPQLSHSASVCNHPVRNTINASTLGWVATQSPTIKVTNKDSVNQSVSEDIRGWTNEDFVDTSSESDIF